MIWDKIHKFLKIENKICKINLLDVKLSKKRKVETKKCQIKKYNTRVLSSLSAKFHVKIKIYY